MAVGSFVIEHQIGKGSFATVYKGHHKVRPKAYFFYQVLDHSS